MKLKRLKKEVIFLPNHRNIWMSLIEPRPLFDKESTFNISNVYKCHCHVILDNWENLDSSHVMSNLSHASLKSDAT